MTVKIKDALIEQGFRYIKKDERTACDILFGCDIVKEIGDGRLKVAVKNNPSCLSCGAIKGGVAVVTLYEKNGAHDPLRKCKKFPSSVSEQEIVEYVNGGEPYS